jgi:hypothetical protein
MNNTTNTGHKNFHKLKNISITIHPKNTSPIRNITAPIICITSKNIRAHA